MWQWIFIEQVQENKKVQKQTFDIKIQSMDSTSMLNCKLNLETALLWQYVQTSLVASPCSPNIAHVSI